jgi:hypothetical protein
MILDPSGQPASSRLRASASSNPAFGHSFDAARRGGYRGFFWFPTLNPAEQMQGMDRETIAEKNNWLYNNVGAMRAVVDGLALDEVDTGLWPKPATKSAAFNAAVKTAFTQQCGFHRSFSADGENNFFSGQMLVRKEVRLRGAAFGQKLRAGEGLASPSMHFLADWQCANAITTLDQSEWRDGRRDNRFGRALQWRFLTNRERTQWLDLDAADVIHFHDPFLIGQKRGISALAPVTGKMFSIHEIEKAETNGVLLRTRIAYAIERKFEAADDGAPTLLPGAVEVQEVDQDDGSKLIIQKIVAQDGAEVEVADLSAGRSLKVVESAKSSEASGWIKELLADVARCTGYPAEYIFGLAGLTQGTLVRMAQQKVQRVVNTIRDFQIILQYIDEWWPFWLWQNIQAGTFDNVRGGVPDEWWPYIVVRPRDLTVDMGREGRLYDERVATGKMPVGLYVGMLYGEDEEDFDDNIIRDAYRRRRRVREIAEELGEEPMETEQIFRPPAGAAPPVPDAESPDDEEEPPPARPANQ